MHGSLPKINGKEGNSRGFSGAPTSTIVPLTLSSSRIGPIECGADTLLNMMSSVLIFD